MKRNFFSKNIVLILFIFSFIIVSVVSFFANYFISFSMRTMEYNVHQRINGVSKILAQHVPPEFLNEFQDVDDMGSPYYDLVRRWLNDFVEWNDVLCVYYMRVRDNMLQYIINSDANGEPRRGPDTPTNETLEDNPWILDVVRGETICFGLGAYKMGSEGRLTAYSPVYDNNKRFIAIAGVDIDDSSIVRASQMVNFLTVVQIIVVVLVFVSGLSSLLRFRREAEKAKAASVAKSNFLSQMSHEIRTPLNAIIGMGELALNSDSVPKMLEYLEGIKQAGHNLLSLINDILDFSKIETGGLQIVNGPYYLASLLNDVINVIQIRLTEKPILFTVNVDAMLPAQLSGDESRIRQILFNLLSNAVKYTQQGTICLRISSGIGGDDEDIPLTISVTDTGIGIKKEDMVNLFGDFVRLDTVHNKSIEGSGLGLAITRSLCRAMGGDILVSSEYGKGSTFIATVPQGLVDGGKLALVEDPVAKGVLFYDHRTKYAESVLETMRDLCVPVTEASNVDDLIKRLSFGGFPFVFTSGPALERARTVIKEKSPSTVLVLLADLLEVSAFDDVRVIPIPAYTVMIADVLNGRRNILRKFSSPVIDLIIPDAKLLVVDDIPANLVVAEGLLTPYSARIDTCSNGARALELIKIRNYDLIFMDHMMPDMDGIETVRFIRQWEKEKKDSHGRPMHIPIIALTANVISGMREMFLSEGFDDYLSKPIDTFKLYEAIKAWVPVDKQKQKNEKEQPEEEPDFFTDTDIEGIDLQRGQERYRGKAFLEVIRVWCLHTPALLEKLRDLANSPLDEKEVGEYTVTVHGFKGATYGICADGTAKKGEDLETAARRKDIPFIRANTVPLINEANRLLQNLEILLASIAEKTQVKDISKSPDPALLTQLLNACKQYKSIQMAEILDKLNSFRYESGGELVKWLCEQNDNLEYDAIVDRLSKELTGNQ